MRIELLKAHTHEGVPHKAGERIDIDEAAAKWLIERAVAKAVAPESNKQPSRKGD